MSTLRGAMHAPIGVLPPAYRERAHQGTSGILRDVASPEEVDRTLRKLVKRLDGAELDGASLPENERSILCVITDLDLTYRADYAGGRIRKLRLLKTPDGTADVRISLGSDELVALANGKTSLPMALLFGRIRVDANARDLLLLRQLF
ncbi:MAG: SCP2 sterol-binding domain-containing protein [Actinobacteria bacterium]|nr:MAG: SCP2 sterol-binding domain-containing protein [Actinomycetota bacterium]